MEPPGAVQGRRLQTTPVTSSRSGPESMYRPKESLSDDNLQLRTLFDRLETITLDPHPQSCEVPPSTSVSFSSKVSTRCSCGNIESTSWGHRRRNGSHPAATMATGDSESESDDEDDEPFSLAALIGMLVAQERKGSARQHGAVRNLADSCRGDMVSDKHLHQLVSLTGSSNQQVRQAAFLALRQAATNEANTKVLLQMAVVPRLLTLLQDKMEAPSHAIAAAVLEKIVLHKTLADHWLEKMITRGLPVLIGSLSSANQAPETKVALGRLLASLARFFEIAVLLLDHCMEDVMEIWLRYPAMKECLTELFVNLVQHTDHTVAGVLEHRVMQHVGEAMREGTCCVQIHASRFFLALCGSSYGLSAILDEGKVRLILRVLRATHCSRVRELGVATLAEILQRATPNQLRDVAHQTESAFSGGRPASEWNDPEGDVIKNEERGRPGARKNEASKRTERGIRILIDVLVETVHKEAKMTLDQNKRVRAIGFRPGVDVFKTLLDVVRCLCHMTTLTVSRQRTRTSSHNARVSVLGSKSKVAKLNSDIVQFMFHQGALCVVNLLGTYTHHLFPTAGDLNSLQQQRNVDILHLQAMMKVWQMATPPISDHPLPDKEELQFVQQLVECARLFARCSSDLWNDRVEEEVKAAIEEHQSWRGDPGMKETTASSAGSYQYVKTVDQAFPSRLKIENVTLHRQRETELRERRANDIQKRRLAWGDDNTDVDGRLPRHRQSQTDPSGDSPKTAIPRKDRPPSAKKKVEKFDLSQSVFTLQQAKSAPSSKLRQPAKDKLNVRTAGYPSKTAAVVSKDRRQESAVGAEEKELHRKLRTRLFQEGVCQAVGPWVACPVPEIQTLAAECLRCIVQPVHPEETQQLRQKAEAKERQNRHKSRSEMAQTLAERDKILSQVIGQMSTGSAGVVKDALGVKGQSEGQSTKTSKGSKVRTKPAPNAANHRPSCNSDEPIGWQCSMHLLETLGGRVAEGLASDSQDVRRGCLLFLYDLVAFGETVVHMKLASLGLVSQLMDFLRKDCRTQDMALIGVMTLKSLIISDYRLKQIFCSQGGEAFLNDLIKISRGALLMNLHQFLKQITEGPGGIL